jgi:DNA-binding transcriptional LysR family regulator
VNAGSRSDLELLERLIDGKTLSAAARVLGVDQTTASRRLAIIERRIGTKLFDRIDGSLVPTPALAQVQGQLRLIAEEATSALAALKRSTAELRGQVRITSVGFVMAHALAPSLSDWGARHPGIAIELIAEDQSLSFARREADIAVRFGRNAEDSTLIKQIGRLSFALFAPIGIGANEAVPVVRYSEALDHLPEMQALKMARPGAPTALRANRLDVLIEGALALGAQVMLPVTIGDRDPRFARLALVGSSAERPLYLLVHPERARLPTVAHSATWVEASVKRWMAPT